MKEDQKFRTESLRLATFLFCKGEEVTGINKSSNKNNKKEVVFVRTPRLIRLVNSYDFNSSGNKELNVNAKDYESARQDFMEKFNEVDRW